MTELNWWTMMSKHWGKIVCGLLGLIFAILVIALNFWWAIFIYVCVALGIIAGWRLDASKGLRHWLDNFFKQKDDF